MDGDYKFGIEEELFVVDRASGNLIRRMSPALQRALRQQVGPAFKPELLQCQIELVSPILDSVAAAREHLIDSRGAVFDSTARYGLGVIAAGTHPFAQWPDQNRTDSPRYEEVADDLQLLARRNILCGLHVHVALPDPDRRIEIMRRLQPFLPVVLGLSA